MSYVYSFNQETFGSTVFENIEMAIKEAFDDPERGDFCGCYIGEPFRPDISLGLDGDTILSDYFENNEELSGEWHISEFGQNPAQVRDLEDRLGRAFREWRDENGLTLKGFNVENITWHLFPAEWIVAEACK